VAQGPMAALDDRPRPGREPTITLEAKASLVALACRKAKDLGYSHELWTTRLLARHAREHGSAQGHACLADLAQGHSPEAWASTVVSDTVWMSWSMVVVCSVAISCWPKTLRTMSSPLESDA
jgi:Homeodomain-like domain